MIKIVFTCADGGVSVMGPCEGARLAYGVTFSDGSVIRSEDARPVDTFLRRWPVNGAVAEWAETEAEFIARIIAKDVQKDATNVHVVDGSEIPSDRTFRNAWKDDNGIKVDMGKAKDLTKDRLRVERKPLLEAQDVAFQRALETGADTSEIVKEKQRLRDITKQVDLLVSLDELKALRID
jgi:hypothetical protein